MRHDVITDQLGRIAFDLSAFLASELITDQRVPSQPEPLLRLIPPAMRLFPITPLVPFLFAVALQDGRFSSEQWW